MCYRYCRSYDEGVPSISIPHQSVEKKRKGNRRGSSRWEVVGQGGAGGSGVDSS